jgi:hypothetical protein
VKRFLHIVLVIVLAAACRGPRIIPKDTLTDIYVDMLMADQFVREENIPRKQLDTMLVYEAVFNKYGYDTDDYMNSVRYYLKDPERYAKVFEEVAKRLEGEVKVLDKIIEHQEWLAQRTGAKYARTDSILAVFSKENMYLGQARFVRDTSRYPIGFRMVPVREDTLMIPVDSLKARTDSLKASADSVVVKDSVETPKSPAAKPVEKPVVELRKDDKLRPHQIQDRELTEKLVEDVEDPE